MSERFDRLCFINIANALESGASFLITEDMQNGMEIRGSLKIVNPFIDLVS